MRFQLEHGPAMKFLMGSVYRLHQSLAQRILIGECDDFGNDITDRLRAQFGAYEQVIMIPQILEERKNTIHSQMGIATDLAPDYPQA